MNHPITEEKLLAAGYRKYRVPLGEEPADSFYQKSVMTSIVVGEELVKYIGEGQLVKYSIGVFHYDLSPYTPDKPDGYMVEARFQKRDGGCFTVENSEDCSIEKHEVFFESIWSYLPDVVSLEVD